VPEDEAQPDDAQPDDAQPVDAQHAAELFVAPPVNRGRLAPSLVRTMRELGASQHVLAVVTADAADPAGRDRQPPLP
jgi:hypothetical protein